MADILTITGLKKRYEGFELGPVDLSVEAGCVTGLIGRNGSGKTTTIKAVLGLVGTDAGMVELLGARVDPAGPTPAMKERIGVVFDTVAFPGEVRVRDVRTIGRAAYESWDDAAFASMAKAFGLADTKSVKELSRGMGMKLSLAFAMSHHADLLILDEPTAGLDPMARGEVLDLLRAFMEDEARGILISTHITTDLERIADVVTCIDGGRVAFTALKDDICFTAGIVRLRGDELDELMASGSHEPAPLRAMRQSWGAEVLVPDRRAFAMEHPTATIETASIERYMELMLKGEAL